MSGSWDAVAYILACAHRFRRPPVVGHRVRSSPPWWSTFPTMVQNKRNISMPVLAVGQCGITVGSSHTNLHHDNDDMASTLLQILACRLLIRSSAEAIHTAIKPITLQLLCDAPCAPPHPETRYSHMSAFCKPTRRSTGVCKAAATPEVFLKVQVRRI